MTVVYRIYGRLYLPICWTGADAAIVATAQLGRFSSAQATLSTTGAGTVALVEPAINGVWFYVLHTGWKKLKGI